MRTYLCTIEGITPILMHRFDDAESTEEASRKIHIKREDRREVAEKGAYRNAAGELYIPGEAPARMLREAAASHKQRGSRKSLKYVVPSAVLVPMQQIVLRDSEGKAITEFEVDSRPVVIPSTKGRVMRHRARIDRWFAEFPVEIDDDMMEPSLIHQIFSEGGSKLGLLDFRPEKGGTFGRFAVVSWAELAQTKVALAAD